MKRNTLTMLALAAAAALGLSACSSSAASTGDSAETGQKTLGIVALVATDALNQAVIQGATETAEAAGWKVVVTDTQGSADKANAAMTTFSTTQKVDAILVSAFASTSIGAGLASATAANVPVVSWGGEPADGIIATTSALKVGEDSASALIDDFGTEGDLLALTYHTGVLCLYRGMALDDALGKVSGINVTANEVAIPGQVEDGTSFASAWLASHPKGAGDYAIWACWDEPVMGAVSALKQAGRDDVKVYSINGAPNALQAVKDGSVTQIIWQDGVAEGTALMQAVLDQEADPESWKPLEIDIPGVLVTAETIDDFLAEHPEALS